jgi:hypothetical protein
MVSSGWGRGTLWRGSDLSLGKEDRTCVGRGEWRVFRVDLGQPSHSLRLRGKFGRAETELASGRC